ncbi:PAS domain-containing protein [Hyphomonas sp.]|uniref:PAS domain-containing protein n=1 Tax=Hyphomonas sp. TaxID=87 RepID=UPI001DE3CD58|nr:PAS domain-containing protein [Hyphomonas sp.]MBU4062849.1 PAS domain-containing protein [Alphaproteobacteria bacterium]MBU4163768.1 PAS domain-containing protein [Alphaproteobacteria bacterium]
MQYDPAPASEESPFGFDELFFSRTDEAGIIRAGNAVFQRVSRYSWDELLNKPHKIIRHPDVPRAVFRLLWNTIKAGSPIGAYVKNRSKDGRHYWVFAIVTPIEGGYLSVRLRPSSDFFQIIQKVYPALAADERRENLDPDASLALLSGQIQGLGFASYPAFMAAALGRELAARDIVLGRPVDQSLRHLDELRGLADGLLQNAHRMKAAYKQNEIVPMNFRILASQLGQDGDAIGVISNNYVLLSDDMRNVLDLLMRAAYEVQRAINDSYFLLAVARVQCEAANVFRNEGDSTSSSEEMQRLDRQAADYLSRAKLSLTDIAVKTKFRDYCLEMNRLSTGLEVMRVVGKVECSRHVSVKERVDKLLSDLQTFQMEIASALQEIDRINLSIEAETAALIKEEKMAA